MLELIKKILTHQDRIVKDKLATPNHTV